MEHIKSMKLIMGVSIALSLSLYSATWQSEEVLNVYGITK